MSCTCDFGIDGNSLPSIVCDTCKQRHEIIKNTFIPDCICEWFNPIGTGPRKIPCDNYILFFEQLRQYAIANNIDTLNIFKCACVFSCEMMDKMLDVTYMCNGCCYKLRYII